MLLTPGQVQKFWSKREGWPAVMVKCGWSKEEGEAQRKLMLGRAGFESLTEVDRMTGFDRVLAEIAALLRPDDLDAQLRLQQMERTRLYFAVRREARKVSPSQVASAPFESSYAGAVMEGKFGHSDPERLSLGELVQLRDTLAARASAKRRSSKAELAAEAQPF